MPIIWGYFGKRGQFIPDKTVKTQFRENDLPTRYRYYELSDSQSGTYAIAGLAPDHTIDSPGWTGFIPDQSAVERLMLQMVMQNAYTAEGYLITNPDKETIGIFYTTIPEPVVHFKSGRFVKFALEIPRHIRQEK